MHDPVNHPTHYTNGRIECIDYIEAQGLRFHEAQVVKYITRWRMKNGLEDLMKAAWYLNRLIAQEKESIPLPPSSLDEYKECGLDGRNCAPCSHTGASPTCPCCDHPERGICSAEAPGIIGNSWTPEVQREVEAENLTAHEKFVSDVGKILLRYDGVGDVPVPTLRSGSRENNTLGDYRRGGPVTSGWMKRPCRYDPNE